MRARAKRRKFDGPQLTLSHKTAQLFRGSLLMTVLLVHAALVARLFLPAPSYPSLPPPWLTACPISRALPPVPSNSSFVSFGSEAQLCHPHRLQASLLSSVPPPTVHMAAPVGVIPAALAAGAIPPWPCAASYPPSHRRTSEETVGRAWCIQGSLKSCHVLLPFEIPRHHVCRRREVQKGRTRGHNTRPDALPYLPPCRNAHVCQHSPLTRW